jgi:hypothetical protein
MNGLNETIHHSGHGGEVYNLHPCKGERENRGGRRNNPDHWSTVIADVVCTSALNACNDDVGRG